MGRPRIHDEAVAEQLLEAAGQILKTHGPAQLTMRRLADETGTSTRAIYSLFGDKAGLLSAMYERMAAVLSDRHAAVPVREDDVVGELVELALAYRAAVRQHPNLYSFVFASMSDFVPSAEQLGLARAGYRRVLGAFERAVDRGIFAAKPAELGLQLHALVHGLASLELAGGLGGTRTAKRRWTQAVEAMLHGFRRT